MNLSERPRHLPLLIADALGRTAFAYSPDVANLQVVGGKLYFSNAFGFPSANSSLTDPAKYGSLAVPVDDWYLYHSFTGEVHCGTAVRRSPSAAFKWWLPQ